MTPVTLWIKYLRYALGAILLFALGLGIGHWTADSPRTEFAAASVYACPSWVSVLPSTALPRWHLTNCVWQDVDQSGGNHNLYFIVVDPFGAPATVYAHQAWPDGDAQQLTLGGQTNFGLYGGSFDPNQGAVGAYCGYVESRAGSDVVCGMGLPLKRHVNYILTFQQVTGTAQPTAMPGPTANPSTPAPDASRYVLSRVARALRLAAADLELPQ